MAEAVVDGLELVQVDEEDGNRRRPDRSARVSACWTRSEKSGLLARFVTGSWNA